MGWRRNRQVSGGTWRGAVLRELWAEVPNFENHVVSTFGRVKNWQTGTVLRPRLSGWGYLQVVVYKHGRQHTLSVHRLVAEAFYDGWHSGLEVNHVDGVKTNNFIGNLEWVTKSQNNQHAYDTELRRGRRTAVRIVETGMEFERVRDCAEYLGTVSTTISAVLTGRLPHYKGHTFVYLNR